MKKTRDYLFIITFMTMAMLIAAAAFKAYSGYSQKKVAEELEKQEMAAVMARNAESQKRVVEMQGEIEEMTGDLEQLQSFINETVEAADEVQSRKEALSLSQKKAQSQTASVSDNISVSGNMPIYAGMTVSDNYAISEDYTVSDNGSISGNAEAVEARPVLGSSVSVSGNAIYSSETTVSGNEADNGEFSVSGNIIGFGDNSVSGNNIGSGEEDISGNMVDFDGLDISGNKVGSDGLDISGNKVGFDGLTVSVNELGGWWYVAPEISLNERRTLRSSYEETLEVNQIDRERIEANQYDFSQMKIACLGDSITGASNLENEENYEQYSYPSKLKAILGAADVVNLGIGGSAVGRYWSDPFVERYTQIPEDTDIIIVMGGTNDGFCVSDNEFGNLNERKSGTFCGDLNELMKGLREKYPSAVIFFATPLPNILHDYLMSEKEYLLPQSIFADVIRTIATEYGIKVIDLYNSNILDSHDANVIADYMPDGVHGNPAGYQILAEHFASEIVDYFN